MLLAVPWTAPDHLQGLHSKGMEPKTVKYQIKYSRSRRAWILKAGASIPWDLIYPEPEPGLRAAIGYAVQRSGANDTVIEVHFAGGKTKVFRFESEQRPR